MSAAGDLKDTKKRTAEMKAMPLNSQKRKATNLIYGLQNKNKDLKGAAFNDMFTKGNFNPEDMVKKKSLLSPTKSSKKNKLGA